MGRKAWISGRATDFDGDGCEDNVEDLDKDNDGINDTEDSCPFTPQRYAFLSNAVHDFDGDGCIDSLEDRDDDADKVVNSVDRCPMTPLGHASDGSGCSKLQLEEERSGKCPAPAQVHWETPGRVQQQAARVFEGKEVEGDVSWVDARDEWFALIRSAWVEVLLGAALSSLLSQATQVAGVLQQQLPASPVGSVRRLSTAALGAAQGSSARKLLVRTVLYTAFFFAVYGYRAMRRMRLPPGFPF